MSSVNRIPPEILTDIFDLCLPEKPSSIPCLTEAPLLLSHVCSLWRNIVLNRAYLWHQVTIRRHFPHVIWFVDCGDRQSLETWIKRSGSTPLHVDIEVINILPTMIRDMLLRTSARWRSVRLVLGIGHFSGIVNRNQGNPMTQLRHLHVELTGMANLKDFGPRSGYFKPLDIDISSFPSLVSLKSGYGLALQLQLETPSSTPLLLPHLRRLDVWLRCKPGLLLRSLATFPNLEALKIRVIHVDIPYRLPKPDVPPVPVTLPNLISFALEDEKGDFDVLKKKIIAPNAVIELKRYGERGPGSEEV